MSSQLSAANIHCPVLPNEVMHFLNPKPTGYYLDATLGLGGHAERLLKLEPQANLIGLDRDSQALEYAKERLAPYQERIFLFHQNYAYFDRALDQLGIKALNGALIDLGVSSLQLDFAQRGFSFLNSAKLDMRMDQNADIPSAYDLVNTASFDWLKTTLARGEEPWAERIAKAIVAARQIKPIATTKELADIVISCYPKAWLKKSRHHPATKTFQAIRLAVNNELGFLHDFLIKILDWLAPGARLIVLTFHSLEDRLVKHFMQDEAKDCLCPPYVDHCVCNHVAKIKILTKKPVIATDAELSINPRAASAKLRCAEKVIVSN